MLFVIYIYTYYTYIYTYYTYIYNIKNVAGYLVETRIAKCICIPKQSAGCGFNLHQLYARSWCMHCPGLFGPRSGKSWQQAAHRLPFERVTSSCLQFSRFILSRPAWGKIWSDPRMHRWAALRCSDADGGLVSELRFGAWWQRSNVRRTAFLD